MAVCRVFSIHRDHQNHADRHLNHSPIRRPFALSIVAGPLWNVTLTFYSDTETPLNALASVKLHFDDDIFWLLALLSAR